MTEEPGLVSEGAHWAAHQYHRQAADLHRLAAHHFAAAARNQSAPAEADKADDIQGAGYQAYLAYGHPIQSVSYAKEAASRDEEGDDDELEAEESQQYCFYVRCAVNSTRVCPSKVWGALDSIGGRF
jgi:hypothetical protein